MSAPECPFIRCLHQWRVLEAEHLHYSAKSNCSCVFNHVGKDAASIFFSCYKLLLSDSLPKTTLFAFMVQKWAIPDIKAEKIEFGKNEPAKYPSAFKIKRRQLRSRWTSNKQSWKTQKNSVICVQRSWKRSSNTLVRLCQVTYLCYTFTLFCFFKNTNILSVDPSLSYGGTVLPVGLS